MKFILALLMLLVPVYAHAISASFVTPTDTIRVGDEFVVEAFLDTAQDNINALEGAVNFNGGLKLKEVRYSGSVVSIWLTRPDERVPGLVDFAGIMPGGYQASPEKAGRGNLFTLVFKAIEKGNAAITLKPESKSYLNDGEGTAAAILASTAQFTIGDTEGESKSSGVAVDATKPEEFAPYIVSAEPYGLQGKVLIFGTSDKDSGVTKYEVAKSYFGFTPEGMMVWEESTSPYLLKNDDESEYLYVRATDQAGNSRIEFAAPERVSVLGAIFVWGLPFLAILILFILYIRHRARTQRPRS